MSGEAFTLTVQRYPNVRGCFTTVEISECVKEKLGKEGINNLTSDRAKTIFSDLKTKFQSKEKNLKRFTYAAVTVLLIGLAGICAGAFLALNPLTTIAAIVTIVAFVIIGFIVFTDTGKGYVLAQERLDDYLEIIKGCATKNRNINFAYGTAKNPRELGNETSTTKEVNDNIYSSMLNKSPLERFYKEYPDLKPIQSKISELP